MPTKLAVKNCFYDQRGNYCCQNFRFMDMGVMHLVGIERLTAMMAFYYMMKHLRVCLLNILIIIFKFRFH